MIKYSFIFTFFFSGFVTLGQVCDGNFGNNIFQSGSFGRGSSQVLMEDPQIAPGYKYTTSLPPSDGYYSIVSSLNSNQLHSSWLELSDNSSDPNGYMMVVNANIEPGLFYEQTVSGLCEDVLYEFSADIFNLNASWATDRIQANVSFLLNDQIVYSTGNIPRNEQWNTYGFTFSTSAEQSELKLSLRNNAPGGIGNDLALDNIAFRPCGSQALILPASVANICEDGEPIDLTATIEGSAFENTFIQWQQSFTTGRTWVDLIGETDQVFRFDNVESGFYYYRYLLADSEEKLDNERCRTFSNTKVIHVIPKFVNVTDSICEGLSISVDDNMYFTSGTYIDSLQNIAGCDSIVTLDLAIVDNDFKANFRVTQPSCDNLSDGRIRIETLSSKGPYKFEIENQPAVQSLITELDAGEYRYKIEDKYGCVIDTLVQISDPPTFEVNLGPDQTLILGERFEISDFVSLTASTYEWEPNFIDCEPPCESISELFTSDITVSLNAISTKGCESSDDVQVTIEELTNLFIPNVITPNQDGKNDYFTIYPEEVNSIARVSKLSIYNRFGKRIFEKKSFQPGIPEIGWDGTNDNSKASSGMYYYLTDVEFINGKVKSYSGYISLLR